MQVAEGRLDVAIQCGNFIWDIHPSIPIIKAAGGVVTNWKNENIISKEPKQKVYKLNPKYLDTPKKIKTKKTQSYKLIYTKFNRFTNKHVSFWRPLPLDQYVSIGDIVIDKSPKMYDPNNKLETVQFHIIQPQVVRKNILSVFFTLV